MIIAVWIVSGLLAPAYLFVGINKLVSPKSKLEDQMTWVQKTSGSQVKVIASLEILGALGLILPVITGILPILTPIAALGLVVLQLVALVVHLRLGEKMIVPNVVLLLLALFVALARFGVFGAI
jgi:hypothetical protein